MKYLLTPEGLALLKELRKQKTLFAFDFDGTLCPIVSHPDQAALPHSTFEYLKKLAQSVPVAIISGRSVSDLRLKISIPNITIIGNHGAEKNSLEDDHSDAIDLCLKWANSIERYFFQTTRPKDILIENKGPSLSLHYRNSLDVAQTKELLLKLIEILNPGPRVIFGKSVINLVPADSSHKGDALLELMDSLKVEKALFIGDDVTDEDIFELKDDRVIGVKILPGKQTSASFFLRERDEIDHVLEIILNGIS